MQYVELLYVKILKKIKSIKIRLIRLLRPQNKEKIPWMPLTFKKYTRKTKKLYPFTISMIRKNSLKWKKHLCQFNKNKYN